MAKRKRSSNGKSPTNMGNLPGGGKTQKTTATGGYPMPLQKPGCPRAVLSLSGGMDSATVLADALDRGYNVLCVGFKYGSKHNVFELAAAQALADYYKVEFRIIDVCNIFETFKSALMANDPRSIPEGHYEDDNMQQTVVPNRNMIFASILAGICVSEDRRILLMGMHAGDHAIYPDCRPEFVNALQNIINVAIRELVTLELPFLEVTKVEILKRGLEMKLPYQITRTCYKNQKAACGLCGSCVERLEAFVANDVNDNVIYEHQTGINVKKAAANGTK